MTLKATKIVLRMRPPGKAWRTVATTTAGADAVAIGDAVIAWTRPTPRDHPEPGRLAFTLLVPDGALDQSLLAYDTEFTISARLRTYSASGWGADVQVQNGVVDFDPLHLIGRGWVTSWRRGANRRHDGRRAYAVEGIDIFGRAAATRLAAAPWPKYQTVAQRIAAINAASPSGQLLDPATLQVTREAFDVDSATGLDVIKRHCPISWTLVETGAGISFASRPNRNARYDGQELKFSLAGNLLVTEVPAKLVEDTGRQVDRGSVVSDVAVTAYWGTETARRQVTWRDTSAGYSSSRVTVDTDERITDSTRIETWARQLMAESKGAPRRLPSPHRVIVEVPERYRLDYLVRLPWRSHPHLLRIVDAPEDIDELQYVTGGSLTISGTKLKLAVETFPARLFGARSIRYSDLPRTANRPRIKQTWTVIGPTQTKTRIGDAYASFAPWPTTFDIS